MDTPIFLSSLKIEGMELKEHVKDFHYTITHNLERIFDIGQLKKVFEPRNTTIKMSMRFHDGSQCDFAGILVTEQNWIISKQEKTDSDKQEKSVVGEVGVIEDFPISHEKIVVDKPESKGYDIGKAIDMVIEGQKQSSQEKANCKCDISTLMVAGCKCGFLKKEN